MKRLSPRMLGMLVVALCAYGVVLFCAPTLAQDNDEPDPARRAIAALQSGDTAGAAQAFREAIERNPKDIGAHVGLAQALLRAGKHDEAIASHRRAIELNPLSSDLRIGFAATLEAGGKPADAIGELRRAVALSPGSPRALTAMAGALRRAQHLREAEDVCLRALGLAPDAVPVHLEMAEIAAELGDWSTALGHYEAAVRLQPENRIARLAHLNALNNAGKHTEAERLAIAMLAVIPDDLDVRMVLASAYEGLVKRDMAVAEYRKVLEKAPDMAIAWGNLGWSQYGAGLLAEAEASSRRALSLDAGLAYVRFNLGLILAEAGRWEEAATEYTAALKGADLADLRAGLSDVETALGRKPGDENLMKAKRLLNDALVKAPGK